MDKNEAELRKECEELRAELEKARNSVAFLKKLIDTLPNPIFAKTGDTRFCIINKAYEEFFGTDRKNLLGRRVLDLEYLPPDERERYQAQDVENIAMELDTHDEITYDTPNGEIQTTYWSKGFSVDETGEKGLVGMIVDISTEHMLQQELVYKVQELENAQQELHLMSRTDALTNLPNRRFFEERLSENLALCRRHDYPLCALMFDLDFFKKVNDTFGHDHGDVVLKSFADILNGNCRSEDIAARLGGEEFILLLPITNAENASVVAERIRKTTEENIILPDGRHQTVSIGLAQLSPADTEETFVKRSDEALYQAKHTGRNRMVYLNA